MSSSKSGRMIWLDVAKGWAILWIVFFHSFTTWKDFPSPILWENGRWLFLDEMIRPGTWHSAGQALSAITTSLGVGIAQLAFHGVGLFLIASGFALAQSAARSEEKQGSVSWGSWIGHRLFRLYPMYWLGHLIYLISPWQFRPEPIDWRFWVSLTGLRFLWIDVDFFYLNAAWWYFTLILQLYALFPILWWIHRRVGMPALLAIALAVGIFSRAWFMIIHPSDGLWVQGGFGLCRLPEFALGMALGLWHLRSRDSMEAWLLGGKGFLAGILLYPLAIASYMNGTTYLFTDLLTGASCFLVVAGASGFMASVPVWGRLLALAGTYSYGLYLIHQPYAIYFTLKFQNWLAWPAIPLLLLLTAVLALWGGSLEWLMNRVMARLLPAKKKG